MLEEICIPRISTSFDGSDVDEINSVYHLAIRRILQKILPLEVFIVREADADFQADQREHFHATLPLVNYQLDEELPANLSFYVLYKYRSNAFKFFFEMITRWLVPGKRLNAVLVYAVDFHMPEISRELYTLCEVMIHVDNEVDLNKIQNHLPIIESEICLGVESSYYARRILEIKGLSPDEKTTMIQEYIAHLVRRLPRHFDIDVMSEMQYVLVLCRDEFKALRRTYHLARIISVQYLFRKSLREGVKEAPEKRHLILKIFRATLSFPEENKPVIGIVVGINFLKEKEVFEKKHLLTAIQNYIPNAQAIEDSFFSNRRGSENICTLYIEIEKNNGEGFTHQEIRFLRKELPIDLQDRIEHLMHPVFMPRNEEEIMRNVLSLSHQLKYIRDIPQITISFDEQTDTSLFFTVILVRVLKPTSQPIQEMFFKSKTILNYIHDRCKPVGYLRKKYIKEATVFRVKLPKENYLRRDHSIDLFKARQFVLSELSRIVGEVRDFNGGIISKQNELLCALRDLLGDHFKYNDLLLENFFYSLLPVAMRSIMDPLVLKKLFLMQLDLIEKDFFNNDQISYNLDRDEEYVYVMLKTQNKIFRDELNKEFVKLQISSTDMANSYVKVYDIPYIGYIYRCDDCQKQNQFCEIIRRSIASI